MRKLGHCKYAYVGPDEAIVRLSVINSQAVLSPESLVQTEQTELKQPSENQKQRRVKGVFKKNKSKNDVRYSDIVNNTVDRLLNKEDDHSKNSSTETEMSTIKTPYFKQKSSESPKRSQSTVNSLIKSVFKMNQGNNVSTDELSKKQKSNGQLKNTKVPSNDNEETYQGLLYSK